MSVENKATVVVADIGTLDKARHSWGIDKDKRKMEEPKAVRVVVIFARSPLSDERNISSSPSSSDESRGSLIAMMQSH